MTGGDQDADWRALDAWLRAGADNSEPAREVHETPIATVYVFSGRALKLKKPVDFGFLDFSTRDKRAWATRRELEFNRPAAPDVYRAVHAVVARGDGFALADAQEPGEEAVDHLLEMRPFQTDAILANRPGPVEGALAERLGRDIARLHAGAPRPQAVKGSCALDYVLRSNAEQLTSLAPILGRREVETLLDTTRSRFEALASVLDLRSEAGLVRRCHGDLHLGNIVVEEGRAIPFDCIEFNDALSEIDVGYDLAFLLMDLRFRGHATAANRVLNSWLDEAGRTFGASRLVGLDALGLFQSVRAAVRCHVSAHAGQVDRARDYLAAAGRHLDSASPRVVAVGGLSGSGKSTMARRLAPRLGAVPGAVVLRSDEVRKRMFGAAPTERLGRGAYQPEASTRVYRLMLEEAAAVLRAGLTVVLDAAFLRPDERAAAEALAGVEGVAFKGVWMEADETVLRERVRTRTGDASDADEAVLERQLNYSLGAISWARRGADPSLDALLEP